MFVEIPWSLIQVVFGVFSGTNTEDIVEFFQCEILPQVSLHAQSQTNRAIMKRTFVSGRKKYAMKNAAKFQQAYQAKAP